MNIQDKMQEINWYCNKIGKKFDEFDAFDKYITDVLKEFVKNLSLSSVSQQREPLSCDCPKCGKEMISEWVKHHHCNKCKEHYTST